MKLVGLVSGGIDSPVAVYLAIAAGHDVVALHMDNRPFTDDATREKALRLAGQAARAAGRRIRTYVVPHGQAQMEFAQNCRGNLECVLCRRMMLRVAERIAAREGAQAVLTGESLGQVASQTLQNIRAEECAISIPVVRPLIGLDKTEIMDIARRIGTYDISISPGLCCTIVPKRPATYADRATVEKEESRVDVGRLASEAVAAAMVMELPGDGAKAGGSSTNLCNGSTTGAGRA